jgi:hypothetical protein
MMLETERGSTRLHAVENSLWKRLWTCHNTGYTINTISIFKAEDAEAMSNSIPPKPYPQTRLHNLEHLNINCHCCEHMKYSINNLLRIN